MDYQMLSVSIALEAQRRGCNINTSAQLAQDVIDRLVALPAPPDLIGVLMNIEYVMRDYGYPAQ